MECHDCGRSFTPRIGRKRMCPCGRIEIHHEDETEVIRTAGGSRVASKWIPEVPCAHRGEVLRQIDCECAAGRETVDVMKCTINSECTFRNTRAGNDKPHVCLGCDDWSERPMAELKWAYGITTVDSRINTDIFKTTVESLWHAGFKHPSVFCDGQPEQIPEFISDLPFLARVPRIRTHGNWILSMYELWIRNPHADRYAIFQDDFVTYKNLRQYLDTCPFPSDGYFNLYTFPENVTKTPGWQVAPHQKGLGAVALVFDRAALEVLLTSQHMFNRPTNRRRGWRAVDGGIVESFRKADRKEYIHIPSLVQHIGDDSSMGNDPQPRSPVFNGTDFDAMDLVPKDVQPKVEVKTPPRRHRIGLVGFHCASGLGELNRQIATHCDIENWLVRPHPKHGTSDLTEFDATVCNNGRKVEEWVRSVDVVVFCEFPFYNNLLMECEKQDKRTVCIPMYEWMPEGGQGWPKQVDLFICPTKQCYEELCYQVPCTYFPWPVDTKRFQFRERLKCKQFLFINGHGGYNKRKGGEVIKNAINLWPDMPVKVRTQKQSDWPSGTDFAGPVESNCDLYEEGDVLIAPHTVDGLGLEPMEAMSAGMPVIVSEGKPWDENPALARIVSTAGRSKFRRNVTTYKASPVALVRLCKSLLNSDISAKSQEARNWAEANCWDGDKVKAFEKLVRFGTADVTAEAVS